MDFDRVDYDPTTVRGCLTDLITISAALIIAALIVGLLWVLISSTVGFSISR